MKVIDEKGKLFGKLNIIDLLVIVLIIAVAIVLGAKLLGGDDTVATASTKLTYTVRVTGQQASIAERLAQYVDAETEKKDQLMSEGQLLNGYVVNYWTEPTRYNRSIYGEIAVVDERDAADAGLVDICFEIEVSVASAVKNEVGTQEVRMGKTHIVKTTHFEFSNGLIESCVWEAAE